MYSWIAKFSVDSPTCTDAPSATGDTSDGPCGASRICQTSASAAIRRSGLIPPAWDTAARTKSMSCSVINCWNSHTVLKTSPMANGTVVRVVQQLELRPDVRPRRGQRSWRVPQVGLGVPDLLDGCRSPAGRFVALAAVLGDAVHGVQPGDAGLRANGLESESPFLVDGVEHRGDVPAGGVGVAQDPVPDRTAEQLVHRLTGDLALDVPQRDVHRADRGHGDRAAPPVDPAVQVLPGVLDAGGVAADQQGCDVVAQVAGDRELAAVESGITPTDDPVGGGDLQRDEVAARAGDDHVDSDDLVGVRVHRATATTLRSGCPAASRVMFSVMSAVRAAKVCRA